MGRPKKMVRASWEGFLNKPSGRSETEVEDMSITDISAVLRGSKAVIYEISSHMLYRQDADDIRWVADRLQAVGVRLAQLGKAYEGFERKQRSAGGRLDHLVNKDAHDD